MTRLTVLRLASSQDKVRKSMRVHNLLRGRTLVVLSVTLALMIAVAGCAKKAAPTPTPTPVLPATPIPIATPTPAPQVREIPVTLTIPRFSPSAITVKAGERVRFVLTGSGFHTFTVDPPIGIDIRFNNAPVTQEVTIPNRPGTYQLYCGPHRAQGMVGTFQVLNSNTPGPTPAPATPSPKPEDYRY